jgi:hypothetical protein
VRAVEKRRQACIVNRGEFGMRLLDAGHQSTFHRLVRRECPAFLDADASQYIDHAPV